MKDCLNYWEAKKLLFCYKNSFWDPFAGTSFEQQRKGICIWKMLFSIEKKKKIMNKIFQSDIKVRKQLVKDSFENATNLVFKLWGCFSLQIK